MNKKQKKKLKGTLKTHSDKLADMETRLYKEKIEALIIGWGLIAGVPLLNLLALFTKVKFMNPSLGPADGLLIWVGIYFLWKGR